MKNCLVVDDSRVIRKVACRILEELSFATEEAEDGAAALASLPPSDARRDPARLEHAENERHRVSSRASRRKPGQAIRWSCSARPRTTGPHHRSDERGRRRIHHEAVRPRDHRGEARPKWAWCRGKRSNESQGFRLSRGHASRAIRLAADAGEGASGRKPSDAGHAPFRVQGGGRFAARTAPRSRSAGSAR